MKFSKSDFRHIKWSLLVFMLALGAGYLMIAASKNFIVQAQREQVDAKRRLDEARSRFATADEDHANRQTYALGYDSLLKRNVIGDDQRLDWIEGLDKIYKRDHVLGLMDFTYVIAPQHPYTLAPPLDSGSFEPNRSGMTLQFDLLHEEQLITFFDTLRTDINGLFILDHCALERSASLPDADDNGVGQQIKAQCTGGWLTLKNRNAK
ncbi:MAG: hypothetical protein PHT15_08590 [Gallionellaceae bacterium]|nr:hypothetical protein [Gallionellaceae bacterium]